MATTLEVKIQSGLQAYGPITSLLAKRSDNQAAVFELQEYQGTLFPSMTFFLVASTPQYGASFRGAIVRSRVQFTIWDTNPERGRAVETQLMNWLDQFNAYSSPPATTFQPNQVILRRQGGNPQTNPLTFWRMVDAAIWNNENL